VGNTRPRKSLDLFLTFVSTGLCWSLTKAVHMYFLLTFITREKGVDKTPDCSTVDIRGIIHQFIVGEWRSISPHIKDIMAKWHEINSRTRLEEG
jgi:hypothetical protein